MYPNHHLIQVFTMNPVQISIQYLAGTCLAGPCGRQAPACLPVYWRHLGSKGAGAARRPPPPAASASLHLRDQTPYVPTVLPTAGPMDFSQAGRHLMGRKHRSSPLFNSPPSYPPIHLGSREGGAARPRPPPAASASRLADSAFPTPDAETQREMRA